jgi:multiple sugar transport system permease protein
MRKVPSYLVWLIPTMGILAVLLMYPVGYLFWAIFHKIEGIHIEFVGFNNFLKFFADLLLWQDFTRSLIYMVSSTTLSLLAGLILALCLNESPIHRVFQPLVLLPWAVPYTVSAASFKWFFNDLYGAANDFLLRLGIISSPISWLLDPLTAFVILVVCEAWTRIPLVTVVFLAGLKSIPEEYYDASKVDGADTVQRFRYVTLPMLKAPFLVVLLVLSIFTIRTVSIPLALTYGGPGHATETLSIYIYKTAFFYTKLGYASAIGVFLLIVVLIISIIEIKAVRPTT